MRLGLSLFTATVLTLGACGTVDTVELESMTAAASDDGADTDGTDTDEPTGAGAGDSVCEDVDPLVDSTLVVDASEWPGEPFNDFMIYLQAEASCTVADVETVDGRVATTLECDDAGTPRIFWFSLPEAEQPVAWSSGDAVTLAYFHEEYIDGYGIWRNDLRLHRTEDGALLVATMNQQRLFEGTFAPLVLEIDEDRCGAQQDLIDTWNMAVQVDNGAGQSVEIGHLQRATLLPPVGEGVLRIDVGEARFGLDFCCHANRNVELIMRRTVF